MIEEAKRYAIKAHKDQKYGDKPYAVHLEAVVRVLNECGIMKSEKLAAGWLHDVIEDTETTPKDIKDRFGHEVERIVWACSGFGENRKARKSDIFRKIAACPEAADVKVADRIANVEASRGTNLAKMYDKERREFHDNVAVHADMRLIQRLVNAYS